MAAPITSTAPLLILIWQKGLRASEIKKGSVQWQPTSVFLPGKFHGQRSVVAYSPWGAAKQWDTTEHACTASL